MGVMRIEFLITSLIVVVTPGIGVLFTVGFAGKLALAER